MIRTMLCTEEYCTRHQLDRAAIGAVQDNEHDLLWLDLEAPPAEELQLIGEEFAFHELAVEDASRPHQRPKIDRYDNFYSWSSTISIMTGRPSVSSSTNSMLSSVKTI